MTDDGSRGTPISRSGHGSWDLNRAETAPYEDEYETYNLKLAGEHAEDERLSRPAPPMSRPVFDSLREGTSYPEVRKLVGGTEHSSGSDVRKVDPRFHSYRTIDVLGYRGNGNAGSGAVLVSGRDSMVSLAARKLLQEAAVAGGDIQ